MQNAQVFESQWKHLRDKLKQHWMALTDRDIDRIDGHVDTLVELLQEKYGYPQPLAEEKVEQFIQEFAALPSR